jgi:predicted DNA-binding transcriptional regulator AlpA
MDKVVNVEQPSNPWDSLKYSKKGARKSRRAEVPMVSGALRAKEISKLLSIGESSWWRGVAEGRYQQGRRLGPRTTVWPAAYVLSLIGGA